MKAWVLGALFLLLIPLASAAVIKGNVYDFYLEEAEAIVTINTSPEQIMVAKGEYSFEVITGSYVLRAEQFIDGILESSAEEIIMVETDGEFIRDIILFPDVALDEELDELEEEIIAPEDLEYEKRSFGWFAWLAIIIVLLVLYYLYKNKPKDYSEHKLDRDAEKVLNFITKQKRTTQKEIRKEFPHSEAKISLIIAELEEKKLVKKIKKGRGNIIIKT